MSGMSSRESAEESKLREQLVDLLEGGNAHMGFRDAIRNFPEAFMNSKAQNMPYTFWHLLEHIRIAQWDILEYIRDPEHVSPEWPDEFWPDEDEKADAAKWNQTVTRIVGNLEDLRKIVEDKGANLFSPIPHAPKHSVLREVIIAADHMAYHIGEFVILRRVVIGKDQDWKES